MPSLIDRFKILVGGRRRAPPRIAGGVERIVGGALYGWVRDSTTPDGRVEVVVTADTGRRVVVRADLLRADVRAAGHGDGYHGFRVALARLGPDVREVRVAVVGSGTELRGSPLLVALPPASEQPAAAAVREVGAILLALDPFSRGRVSGWLVDTAAPGLRPLLELRDGGRVIARDRACRYRPDAGADGLCGFALYTDPDIPVSGLSLAISGRAEPLLRLVAGTADS